jgi:hypothetical protein
MREARGLQRERLACWRLSACSMGSQVSGRENITSIDVEQAIASHPAVLDLAVVGVADDKWGEVPLMSDA